MARAQYNSRAIEHIRRNTAEDIARYAETVISLPESRRWDYAIPENYTNYQDGFLEQNDTPYRGCPMLNYRGTILYLYRILDWCDLLETEAEKYLLFDRHGRKYTFVTTKEEPQPGGNPSYFDFLPRVKRYAPTRAEIIKKRLSDMKKLTENAAPLVGRKGRKMGKEKRK